MTNGTGRYYIEALGRGMHILESFIDGPAYQSLKDISARVNLQKGTTFRLLRTLEETGYVAQDVETKRYYLAFKILDLQRAALAVLDFPQHAQPHLEQLNQSLSESVSMSILDGNQIRYVARAPAQRIMSINLQIGSALPAHATSMGKVLLAGLSSDEVRARYPNEDLEQFTDRTLGTVGDLLTHLDHVREQGYAVANEELEHGLRSVAAPVRNRAGSVIAAINVSASSARATVAEMREEFVPPLMETSVRISEQLGFQRILRE